MSILPTDHDACVVRHIHSGEAPNARRVEYFTDPIARAIHRLLSYGRAVVIPNITLVWDASKLAMGHPLSLPT
jgi:hypothetical protein